MSTSLGCARRWVRRRWWPGLPATCSTSSPTCSTRGGSNGSTEKGATRSARGAVGMAADRLGAALALWRGPAFADVRDGGLFAHEAGRLDELRIIAQEERIDAELSLGHHASLVAELERLVAVHPLRERLWRQLVLALYHSPAPRPMPSQRTDAHAGFSPIASVWTRVRSCRRLSKPCYVTASIRHLLPRTAPQSSDAADELRRSRGSACRNRRAATGPSPRHPDRGRWCRQDPPRPRSRRRPGGRVVRWRLALSPSTCRRTTTQARQ